MHGRWPEEWKCFAAVFRECMWNYSRSNRKKVVGWLSGGDGGGEAKGSRRFVAQTVVARTPSLFSGIFKVTLPAFNPGATHPPSSVTPLPDTQILKATHLLMLRVLRTHDVYPSLPPHNTAPIAHNLHTRADLHPSCQCGCCSRHSRQRVVVLVLDMVRKLDGCLAQALEERAACSEQWSEHCG